MKRSLGRGDAWMRLATSDWTLPEAEGFNDQWVPAPQIANHKAKKKCHGGDNWQTESLLKIPMVSCHFSIESISWIQCERMRKGDWDKQRMICINQQVCSLQIGYRKIPWFIRMFHFGVSPNFQNKPKWNHNPHVLLATSRSSFRLA